METNEEMQTGEICLNDLPTEILMKIMSYLTSRDKLNLSAVSHRFMDIFSDEYYAKDLLWRVEGYIHPELLHLGTDLNINYQRFKNIEIGKIDAFDDAACLQLFSKIGQYTTFLKINSFSWKGPKSLLNCFPQIETLFINETNDLLRYDSIPVTITTIKVIRTNHLISQRVLSKLRKMKNLKILTSDNVDITDYQDCVEDDTDKLLFRLTESISHWFDAENPASISVYKSLLNATIEPLDVKHLNCIDLWSMCPFLKEFKNLEKFINTTYDNDYVICYNIHDVEWPKLKTLNLRIDSSCSLCKTCFNAIIHNFPQLKELELPFRLDYESIEAIRLQLPLITDFAFNISVVDENYPRDMNDKFYVIKNFHRLEKLTVYADEKFSMTMTTLEDFPSLPHLKYLSLQYLSLLPDPKDAPCLCDYYQDEASDLNVHSGDDSDDDDEAKNCPFCYCVPIDYAPRDWTESAFTRLAQKCPDLKYLNCRISQFNQHDLFATLNAWSEIQTIEISDNTWYCNSFDFLAFIDFLNEQKENGWKPPLLKIFKYRNINYKIKSDAAFKLFEIIPSLKEVEFNGSNQTKVTKTLADYQKRKYFS